MRVNGASIGDTWVLRRRPRFIGLLVRLLCYRIGHVFESKRPQKGDCGGVWVLRGVGQRVGGLEAQRFGVNGNWRDNGLRSGGSRSENRWDGGE